MISHLRLLCTNNKYKCWPQSAFSLYEQYPSNMGKCLHEGFWYPKPRIFTKCLTPYSLQWTGYNFMQHNVNCLMDQSVKRSGLWHMFTFWSPRWTYSFVCPHFKTKNFRSVYEPVCDHQWVYTWQTELNVGAFILNSQSAFWHRVFHWIWCWPFYVDSLYSVGQWYQLPPPPSGWDYKYRPMHSTFMYVLQIQTWIFTLLSKVIEPLLNVP